MRNLQDVYPLSPAQHGMLFHTLYAAVAGVYIGQVVVTIRGPLDDDAFVRAWRQVVERHDILRTFFLWEGLREPVQVVQRRADFDLATQDWQDAPPDERRQRLEALLLADRGRGYELTRPPLMRLTLLRLGPEEHRLVWSYHHLLTDGWSAALILEDLRAQYGACRRGEATRPAQSRPFRDYIVWLRRQDLAAAERYWRETLRGFREPVHLRADGAPAGVPPHVLEHDEERVALSAAATAALRALARQYQVTLSTVVLGAWALLLGRDDRRDDVVFGVTLSGRPPALPGVEEMVGPFINTLPARVRLPAAAPMSTWLRDLQARQAELRGYEYSPLVEVQGWSEIPRGRPLFENLVVVENYPEPYPAAGVEPGLTFEDLRFVVQNHYPLTLRAVPGPGLALHLMYDRRRFDRDVVAETLGDLAALLDRMAAAPAVGTDVLRETLAGAEGRRRETREDALRQAGLARLARARRRAVPVTPPVPGARGVPSGGA